jgi:hypothetical protein
MQTLQGGLTPMAADRFDKGDIVAEDIAIDQRGRLVRHVVRTSHAFTVRAQKTQWRDPVAGRYSSDASG